MRLKNLKGQGLIESLIAMILVFGTVVALMSFQATLAYRDSISSQLASATILAVNEMETLRDYQVLNTEAPYAAYSSIASGSSTSTGADTTYTLTWTVTSYTNPTYKNISIAVSWTDRRNLSHTITIISNVAGIDPTTSSSVM